MDRFEFINEIQHTRALEMKASVTLVIDWIMKQRSCSLLTGGLPFSS